MRVPQAASRVWSLQMFHGKASRPASVKGLKVVAKPGNFGSVLENKSIWRHSGNSDPCSLEINFNSVPSLQNFPGFLLLTGMTGKVKNLHKCQVLPFLLFCAKHSEEINKATPHCRCFSTPVAMIKLLRSHFCIPESWNGSRTLFKT